MKPQINLDKNKRYLLACSFGPDSMCLFHLLLAGNYSFDVAHVNYGLRPEAKNETEQLNDYCQKNHIKLFTLFAQVDRNKNIEEECRKIRYSYFQKLAIDNKYDFVLVAHNEDDLLETYIMQKQRNIYANYYGIAEKINLFGVDIERPLLKNKKLYLEEYCKENNVPYCIDSSNLTNEYLRNRIRHNIISKMSDSERADLLDEINLKNIQRESILKNLSNIDISRVDDLLSLNEEEFNIAINQLAKHYNPIISISARCCNELRKILLSNKPNIVFEINEKVLFTKEYDKCYFVSNKKEVVYSFTIEKPSIVDNEFFYFDFTKNLKARNLTIDDFPITIRTKKAGDTILIKDYVVSVRRLFIDFKMPISTRKTWPLLVNKWGTVKYVPRYRADFDIKSSPDFYVKR